VPEILLATHSAGKLLEIREMTRGGPVRWRALDEFPNIGEALEDGATFADNARRKALHYAAGTGLHTLADDSGLAVDSLGGAPGVHSARYAGTPRDDEANNRKLVEALQGVSSYRRTARFQCAMALALDGEILLESEGVVEGIVIDEARGTNGFGYDPHFLIPSLGRTTAELSPAEKNARSHRGQALRHMLKQVEEYFRAREQWDA
jgi:XTP/dITP diphosphohydrolase